MPHEISAARQFVKKFPLSLRFDAVNIAATKVERAHNPHSVVLSCEFLFTMTFTARESRAGPTRTRRYGAVTSDYRQFDVRRTSKALSNFIYTSKGALIGAREKIRTAHSRPGPYMASTTALTVAQYLQGWLNDVVEFSRRRTTYVIYKLAVRHIESALGRIRLKMGNQPLN
jgi:hypothetical protein